MLVIDRSSPAVGEQREHCEQQQDEHQDERERQDERVQVWEGGSRLGGAGRVPQMPPPPSGLAVSPLAVSSVAGSDQALQKPPKLGSAMRARTMNVYRVEPRRLLSEHSVRPSRISTWGRGE